MNHKRAHEATSPLPTSRLELAGTPVAVFEFARLPSINDYIRELGRHAAKGGQFEKQWRTLGHRTVETWIEMAGHRLAACRRADGTTGIRAKSPVIASRIFVVWKVWKGSKQMKDSAFNLYTKPVEDGITDSGFWPGDDDRYVLGRTTLYCGLAAASRVTCEIHHVPGVFDGHTYGIVVARANVEGVPRSTGLRDVKVSDLKRRAGLLREEAGRAEEAEGVAVAALAASHSFCGVGRGRRRRPQTFNARKGSATMSFSQTASGSKAEVLEQVEGWTGYGDTSQLERVKQFVREEISNSPDGYYSVSAYGHHDASTRNVSVNIQPTSAPAAAGGQQPNADATVAPQTAAEAGEQGTAATGEGDAQRTGVVMGGKTDTTGGGGSTGGTTTQQ